MPEVRNYTVGLGTLDWMHNQDEISRSKLWAIVEDRKGRSGPFEAYAEGEKVGNFQTADEADAALKREFARRQEQQKRQQTTQRIPIGTQTVANRNAPVTQKGKNSSKRWGKLFLYSLIVIAVIALVSSGILWLISPHPLFTFTSLKGRVNALAWSPDAKYIALADDSNSIQLWDANDRHLRSTFHTHVEAITFIVWSSDSKLLAVGGGYLTSTSQPIEVWNVSTGKLQHTFGIPHYDVVSLVMSPNGRFLAAFEIPEKIENQPVQIWNVSTGKIEHTIVRHSHNIESLSWSPNGKFLAIGTDSSNAPIEIWNIVNWKMQSTIGSGTYTLAWSPDGKMLATSGYSVGGSVAVWNVTTGKIMLVINENSAQALSDIAWSPNGKYILSADVGQFHLWNVATKKLQNRYSGKSDQISPIVWSSNGRYIALANVSTVEIWPAP